MKLFEPRKFLVFFIIINTIIATLIPSLVYRVLPLDTVEAVIWGQEFTMGNYKHPPLSGWLANGFSALFGYSDFAMYFLSQILVALSYIYIYRLAREFFSERKAVASSILLGLTVFYSFDSAKYNVNIIHLALWPMVAFYFIRGVKENKISSWIYLGITAGLCVICKLFGGLLLAILFCYMFLDKKARSRFCGVGPYLAAILSLLVMFPYFKWLCDNDFIVFKYISNRVNEVDKGFWFPIIFFFMMLAPLLMPLAALVVSSLGNGWRLLWARMPKVVDKEAFRYAGVLFFVPIIFMFTLSIFVPKIDMMWCYPIYFPMGMVMLSFFSDAEFSEKWFKRLALIVLLAIFAFNVGDVIYFGLKPRLTGHFYAKEFALKADSYYREHNQGKAIPYVYGEMWMACLVQHYLPYRPMVCIQEDPLEVTRWRDTLRKEGGFIVCYTQAELDEFTEKIGASVQNVEHFTFPYDSWNGKTKSKSLIFATINPESIEK